ncbi:sensor histidine kinase [Paracoccus sp. PAR01]|uniref:sensor histidine kinase n=1 Tax=Paracoccus sp. PAR01 TaxID=2769282 RepID=UPI00177FE18F|nr:histidine kinase [Paracoccus sp. PAR01]MBD9529571.1 hypothetical protein [Paracoccus sp. PAR01]
MNAPQSNASIPPRGTGIRAAYLWIAGAWAATLIGGAFIVLSSALSERDARLAQLPQMAGRLSLLLDREIETTLARLVGLSSSPALVQNDLRGFHQQMMRTPLPKGTVLAISDQTRQLANAAMPFGTALPELSAYTPQPLFFERLEAEGTYISSRVYGPVAGINAVTVSMKIPDAEGALKYFLTTAILGDRLAGLMRHAEAALPGGRIMLFDAMGQELTSYPETKAMTAIPGLVGAGHAAPRGLVTHSKDAPGLITGYDRSALTGWTVAATAGQDWIGAPLTRARRILLIMSLAMLAAAGLVVLLLRNRVSRPFQAMVAQLQEAKREVVQLGDTLIVARTQEHRRIAQELHDTTAQKLVAADLYLQSMDRAAPASGHAQLPLVRLLLSQALDELRTFSFLLRPDQPADEGFRDCMEALVHGFCDRAGLRCTSDFPAWLDDLNEPIQTVFLRITREALSNIYRHAKAGSVSARAEWAGAEYILTIEDDGVGGVTYPSKPSQHRAGLGITGMAQALSERAGRLKIMPLTIGTKLTARVPEN